VNSGSLPALFPPSAVVPPFLPRRSSMTSTCSWRLLPDGRGVWRLASPASREDLWKLSGIGPQPPGAHIPAVPFSWGSADRARRLASVVQRLGHSAATTGPNPSRNLHRISAFRNRVGRGWPHCRVAGPCSAHVAMVRDLLDSGRRCCCWPAGVGKPRRCARSPGCWGGRPELGSWVMTPAMRSAGDGDIPHPAIGQARRMAGGAPELQPRVIDRSG